MRNKEIKRVGEEERVRQRERKRQRKKKEMRSEECKTNVREKRDRECGEIKRLSHRMINVLFLVWGFWDYHDSCISLDSYKLNPSSQELRSI